MAQSLCTLPPSYPWLAQPLSEASPCGDSLDYHPGYLALQQELTPMLAAEYGDFTAPHAVVEWQQIEPRVIQLLAQGRDIRLIILLIRCRLPTQGVVALTEGIEAILYLIHRWPQHLHPQCVDEGEQVPEYRQNALLGLEDEEGLLAELRQISVNPGKLPHLSLSEFEQLLTQKHPLSLEKKHHLARMIETEQQFFDQCSQAQHRLQQLCELPKSLLGCDPIECVQLTALLRLFSHCPCDSREAANTLLPTPIADPPAEVRSLSPMMLADPVAYRSEALTQLGQLRDWFAYYEPSNPIQLVLQFAEKSIGKDFHTINQMYCPELITLLKVNED